MRGLLASPRPRAEWVLLLEPTVSLGADLPFLEGVSLLWRPAAGGVRPAYLGEGSLFPSEFTGVKVVLI